MLPREALARRRTSDPSGAMASGAVFKVRVMKSGMRFTDFGDSTFIVIASKPGETPGESEAIQNRKLWRRLPWIASAASSRPRNDGWYS